MKRAVIAFGFFLAILSGCVSMDYSKDPTYFLDDSYRSLIEKEAVKDTVENLFIATDNRDWIIAQTLFSDKVQFDVTSLAGGEPVEMTPREIVDAWDKGLKSLKAIHHQTGNYQITIHHDQADVFCYGIAFHYLPNSTNRNTRTFVGSYDLHLTKKDNAWRIDGFKFNLKFIDGNLELESS
jgi:hypothetical protein